MTDNIHSFLKQIHNKTQFSVYFLAKNQTSFHPIFNSSPHEGLHLTVEDLPPHLQETDIKEPFLFMDKKNQLWGVLPDSIQSYYLFGSNRQSMPADLLTEVLTISNSFINQTFISGKEIPFHFSSASTQQSEFFHHYQEQYCMDRYEKGWGDDLNPYEKQFIHIIQTGDIDALKKQAKTTSLQTTFDLSDHIAESSYKKIEYLCIASATLVSRASVQGGTSSFNGIRGSRCLPSTI